MSILNAEELKYVHDVVWAYFQANAIEQWEDITCDNYDIHNAPDEYDVECKDGATKVVLVCNDKNFVIKIPTYGEMDCDWTSAWMGAYSVELDARGYEITRNDYCELEMALYECAQEQGLDKFLVPTEFVGEMCGIPIYVQPKITYLYSQGKHSNEDEYTYASIANSDMIEPSVGAELLVYYTIDEVRAFLEFVRAFGMNDLDAKRNGWFAPEYGRYVFWDYAGFHN